MPAIVRRRCTRRLHADDAQLGAQRSRHGDRSHGLRSATDRDEQHVEIVTLLEQFERHRTGAREHMHVVRRVRERQPIAVHEPLRDGDGVVVVNALLDHPRTPRPQGGGLFRIVAERHADGNLDAELTTGIRESQSVVPGGCTHYAAGALRCVECRERREAVAHLEGAGWLHVLVLHEQRHARQRGGKSGILPARRRREVGRQALAGGVDVAERDRSRHSAWTLDCGAGMRKEPG